MPPTLPKKTPDLRAAVFEPSVHAGSSAALSALADGSPFRFSGEFQISCGHPAIIGIAAGIPRSKIASFICRERYKLGYDDLSKTKVCPPSLENWGPFGPR